MTDSSIIVLVIILCVLYILYIIKNIFTGCFNDDLKTSRLKCCFGMIHQTGSRDVISQLSANNVFTPQATILPQDTECAKSVNLASMGFSPWGMYCCEQETLPTFLVFSCHLKHQRTISDTSRTIAATDLTTEGETDHRAIC